MRKIDADNFKKALKEYQEYGEKEIKKWIEQKKYRNADRCSFMVEATKDIIKGLDKQPTLDDWVPCSKRMPEEHDSTFAKLKGTDKWNECMWEKSSGKVNITVEFEDGTKKVMTSCTQDGEWKCYKEYKTIKMKVIAWQPLPDPYEGE